MNVKIEIGEVDSVKDVIHELNELVLSLEVLEDKFLKKHLKKEDYIIENMDSLLIITE